MKGNVAACVELQRGVFVRIARVMEDPTQRAKALRFAEERRAALRDEADELDRLIALLRGE
jgi:hypothetical protein